MLCGRLCCNGHINQVIAQTVRCAIEADVGQIFGRFDLLFVVRHGGSLSTMKLMG
jgi:hypothetical protein